MTSELVPDDETKENHDWLQGVHLTAKEVDANGKPTGPAVRLDTNDPVVRENVGLSMKNQSGEFD